jgi:hypothetical protein
VEGEQVVPPGGKKSRGPLIETRESRRHRENKHPVFSRDQSWLASLCGAFTILREVIFLAAATLFAGWILKNFCGCGVLAVVAPGAGRCPVVRQGRALSGARARLPRDAPDGFDFNEKSLLSSVVGIVSALCCRFVGGILTASNFENGITTE